MFDFHRYPKYQIVLVSRLGNKSGVTPTFSVAPLPMHDPISRRSDLRSLTSHISKTIAKFKKSNKTASMAKWALSNEPLTKFLRFVVSEKKCLINRVFRKMHKVESEKIF